jgi:prepilin-type N-terminal cleavage/methylation domain-containing protein
MKKSGLYSQRGASVIEVLIVVTIIAILAAFAIARFGTAKENFDRRNIAREFKVSLERARFDSVKRRANVCTDMSGVTVNTTNFTLMTDMNQNGTLEGGENRQISIAGRSDVTIVPNGVTLPFTIRFDERGRAYINDCSVGSTPSADIPLLYFCNGTCTVATATDQNSSVIFVSPAGTVAMLDGGSGMPTFDPPTVSTQVADSGIDRQLLVTDPSLPAPSPSASPTGTGTPVSTPDPSPSPSVSPTVSPDPSGTPTPTPTATPTPAACPTVAPWGVPPACTCISPQRVRGNGECK